MFIIKLNEDYTDSIKMIFILQINQIINDLIHNILFVCHGVLLYKG